MTAITVAVKVGIVLVELHMSPAETLVSAIGCALDDALPGPVMRQQVFERATFGSGIFGMGVVVVESRAVRQDQIALHLVKRKRSMRVDLGEIVLFFVLLQAGHTESPRILMRIFTP